MSATTHDTQAIHDALALIVAPGQVVELRVPSVGGRSNNTASGYFDDLDLATHAAARYNGRDTVYITLQEVNPALLARAANRVKEYAKATTADSDIIRRRFLGIDCDAQRPAGISASDAEHEAGVQRAFQIRAALRAKGWPDPIFADSGNGGHLLYPVALPADDAGLTQRILKILAAQFNDDIVKIDETVYNAGRVWKCYGTHACKGDSTPDRPHRLARIIEAPDVLTVVPVALLESLAGGAPAPPPTNDQPQPAKRRVDVFDVEDYLREHGVAFSDPVSYRAGKKWMLDACVWAGHTDKAAVVWQLPDGTICANCSHNSCEGRGWTDLRETVEPGYKAAKEARERDYQARQRETQPGDASEVVEPPIDRKLNEVANAARFVRQHGANVRYCKTLDTWYVWDGTRWQADTRGAVMELAKMTAASIYHEAADAPEKMRDEVANWARRSHFRAGLTVMVALAQSDPAVSILDTDLDADRWVLNCMNCTLDLLTKRCPVIYDPDATLPLWDTFIATVTSGDTAFADFLRRAAGATLVGENLDEVLFLPHGGGGGGKSTFLEALKGCLGEYAKTADFETFIKKRGDAGIRNDIARLAGARLVVSIEVDEGKHLAMALLKTLTGGEDTTARFLYKEATESRPTYSLWLAANHAPTVRSDDDATWRRILRLPFTNLVPKEKRDPAVKATLRNPNIAGAAILAWAMRGCLEWHRNGLNVPTLVEQATEQFRHEMNPLSDWADECCDLSPQAWTATDRLWGAYQTYAQEEGPRATATKKAFAEHLKALGCEAELRRAHGKPTRGWRGIAFKDDGTPRGDARGTSDPLHDKKATRGENTDGARENPDLTPLPVTDVTDRNGYVSKSELRSPHEGEVTQLSVTSVTSVTTEPEEIAWEWIVAVKAEREFGIPDAVLAAAIRLGCALDSFAAAEDEAARLADYLDRHAAMKGSR